MSQCTAIKPSGERCKLPAKGQQGLCWSHDPANHTERHRVASRGGRGKKNQAVAALKTLLSDLTDRVLEGELETSRAAVANQLINTHLRAIEQERKVKDTEELEARVEALEEKPMKGFRQ